MMIVGGIVLNRGWWSTMVLTPSSVSLQVSTSIPAGVPPNSSGAPSIMPEAEAAMVDDAPLPDLAREPPDPFIQIGGLPVIFGTAIISHFLASEWGQRLLYGSEEDQMTYEIQNTR